MTTTKLLLTGATGFLGGAVLARGITNEAGEDARFLLTVRASTEKEARARVLARLSRFLSEESAEARLDRCDVVCVDLQDASTLADPRFDEVTHVMHLAANTSFVSGKGVWETNFHGALAFARRMARVAALERFVYVGTAMVCGDDPPEVVHECAYPSPNAKHLVPYTESKAAAELAMAQELRHLPLVVARPSIVVGHTELGCVPSGSIFWVIRALDRLGMTSVPAESGMDIVPVDWVADGLVHLTFAPRLAHSVYHLSAGTGSRTITDELARSLAAAEGRAHDPSRFELVRADDILRYRARLANAFGRLNGRRMELALALYLSFGELDVVFDNSRILAEGLPPPPSLADYAHVCLERPKDMDIIAQAADEL